MNSLILRLLNRISRIKRTDLDVTFSVTEKRHQPCTFVISPTSFASSIAKQTHLKLNQLKKTANKLKILFNTSVTSRCIQITFHWYLWCSVGGVMEPAVLSVDGNLQHQDREQTLPFVHNAGRLGHQRNLSLDFRSMGIILPPLSATIQSLSHKQVYNVVSTTPARWR